MNEETPALFYANRREALKKELYKINQQRKRIAWLRLLVVIIAFFVIYKTWNAVAREIIIIEMIVSLFVFLFIVSKDTDAKNKADNLQHVIDVNDKEISILNHNYQHYETGEQHLPANHAYAEDFDIFGKASVYQYINRCTSQQGKSLLALRLLHPSNKKQIETEQEAVAELKTKTNFRQQLQAFGAADHLSLNTENKIKEWLSSPLLFTNKKWSLLAFMFPFFTISFIFLYIVDVVQSGLFYFIIFICYLFAFFISSKISNTYDMLSKLAREIETLQKQLQWIEKETFLSKKMRWLQKQLANINGKKTGTEIKKLYGILNRFDIRLNHFAFFFLNTFLLWDLQQLLALNKWKQQNEESVANWFSVIAETEVSSSLATLSFNQPKWCFPVIVDDFFEIDGTNIGHPLLPENNRVDNSFSLSGKGKIAIVTGSNMGGKSTFLRSVGVNTVLALMGAPVCADSFSVSVIKLMSSMRVTDNLAENTSTFYAELKKLKTIIEAVNNNEKIFILLDEILRGTNSLDRHTGSVALLKQLIQKRAVAIIATHDVELAKLQTDYPQAIYNYHFDVQAKGNELYFDYKLKEGICQSMNASILMKNIGIEME